ncbi:flippase [Pseudanabaenaceae cyanobacterium LEGE 13415]|nr:flippase [Pseudanabaenaceae cyanobacterium LEGE 13415]
MFQILTKMAARFSPHQRKIISNTGWLLISRVLRTVVNLFITALIARYLQPDGYGQLQYALAFCSFFLPLSTAQMGDVVTRDLVKNPEDQSRILGTAFTVQLFGGMIAAISAIAMSLLIAPTNSLMHLLVAIISLKFIFISGQPIENWFDSKVDSKFKVFAGNIAFAIITAIEFSLVLNQAPLYTFAITVSLESLIYGLGLFFFYSWNHQNPLQWRTDFSRIRYLLIESMPLCFSTVSLVLYKNLDRVMLANLVDNQSVGIYSSAATLAESLCFLPTILCVSLYPTIIRAKHLEASVYNEKLQKIYDLVALTAYLLILGLAPIAGFVITLIYGQAYQAAIPIFSLYIWSSLFSFLGIVQSRWIVAEGLQKFNFYSRVTGLALNLALNLVLIPRYQAVGATIATIISYAIANYVFFLFIPRTRDNAHLMTKALFLPFRLPQFLKSFSA